MIQQTLKDLDEACRKHGTWKVRWKSKAKWWPSFRFPTAKHLPVERIGRKWGRVYLPKFGWARFRMSRRLGGSVRSATVSRDGRHWFISFLIDDGIAEREQHASPRWVGVDRGVVTAAVTSDGEFFDRRHAATGGVSSTRPPPQMPGHRKNDPGYLTPGEAQRYLRLQRQLARTTKGSKRRKRVRAAMGEIMRRVRWRRADFNAQTAHRLTGGYGHVVIEELNTKGMSAAVTPKPDPARPGRFLRNGAAAKSGLNKAILDKGWYGLEVALRSKARYTGSAIHKINPAYTSQTCPEPACGKVDEKSRKSQAIFSCTSCGHTEHADIVGARNIKSKGQAAGPVVSGRGDPAGSAKRQAPRSRARESPPLQGEEQVNYSGATRPSM
ncbi:RNA-guided endonuclease InsQ/TnpB family protein [Nonomuraea insulae]|uniref:RNA-guided endonuclease InsQ/TnpB family protein n=1 Tax=Nonomuraea insulae TaxID=1616787 RepID=A0ABW1D9S9_9ACTN